jgi:hypothetical protein
MSPAARTLGIDCLAVPWLADVVDDVIRPRGVATHTGGHVIEIQLVTQLPGNHVIRARRIATHSK